MTEESRTREALNATEAELAEKQAVVRQTGETKAKRWKANEQTDKAPASGKARVAGAEAKLDSLTSRLHDIEQRIKELSEVAPQIEDLERKRAMDEANYKYFAASLEKARVDEALDPAKMPNISAVQRPSSPVLDTKPRDKIALGLAGGGLALGIALVLLRELVLNRRVSRPSELENRLHIPLLLSIPYKNSRNGHSSLPPNGTSTDIKAPAPLHSNLAPWDARHFMRPYCDAIRDRLGLYFELNNLTHKPKLVGVAGFSDAAGASTLAAGLAASLSETNEKVLLVDVSLGPEEVHPFFKGKPAYSLAAALKPRTEISSASDNLYLATVASPTSGGLAQVGLKKFFDMMPNMKASDFDYIIFDMPSLHQTSPTWGMAAFMDKLLLVVEAGKNSRDVITRGYAKLTAERLNLAVVLNKTRSYVPKLLDSEA
jgi:Mrp family chromosome partitioning ATPase